MYRNLLLPSCIIFCVAASNVFSQEEPAVPAVRGSLIEDRAARKLLEAGDGRYDADEVAKAVEVWQSVIERYPRSRVRLDAHMRLGDYFLERDRSYDQARLHFDAVADEENRDEAQRAEATLKLGMCFYHGRDYGKCFQVMRDVIEEFPISAQVNQAYYYIGLGHFQLGHYSRAIAALEKVGTTLAEGDGRVATLEIGKRLFAKIEDADLAVLDLGQIVQVRCEATSGDVETIDCYPVGRNVRIVLGSIVTRLGKPIAGNGQLEVKGDDKVRVTYIDRHTSEQELDRKVLFEVVVVGSARVQITDGAFSESLHGVVLGKGVNVQIADADRDLSDNADSLKAAIEVYRRKTDAELDAELAEAAVSEEVAEDGALPERDTLKRVDRVEITLTEAPVKPTFSTTAPLGDESTQPETELPAADTPESETDSDPPAEQPEQTVAEDDSVHSGVFRAVIPLKKLAEADQGNDTLDALPGDVIRVVYLDEKHRDEGIREVRTEARCLEGNIGGVRVTRAIIYDEELRIQTKLRTADALTRIGNRYKEFGLKENADEKYKQALTVCDGIMSEARKLGGTMLEQTYVQLWQIYYEMDRLGLAAAMCRRLQTEFPSSGFVDDALLQMADVAREQGDYNRAIGIYSRLAGLTTSQLRGEAQLGVAECYELMAEAAGGAGASQLHDRAFQEYKKVYEQFPQSGRVGEAVAKMADYYYRQKDYARAIDTFETVLSSYPDAKFMDVILFNYGRCLYRMDRKREAQQRFDQLIADFPDSSLAPDAKRISQALSQAG
ncbi:MAG: tetratricopeptide repeat protein [Thermoguttaceae bacterium]